MIFQNSLNIIGVEIFTIKRKHNKRQQSYKNLFFLFHSTIDMNLIVFCKMFLEQKPPSNLFYSYFNSEKSITVSGKNFLYDIQKVEHKLPQLQSTVW